jgi:hypothetical protein
VLVNGRVGRHARVHVGDRDKNPDLSVARWHGHRELIEVARVVVVDRAPEQIALIANRPVDRVSVDVRLARLRLCSRREVGLEAVVFHRSAGERFEPAAMRC